MSEPYSKLFASITESTIWRESPSTRLVWITMLALKRRDGVVYASIPGLASRANVSNEETEQALACLLSPDPYSRTKEYEGRRIEETDGGWKVLNAKKFDAIRSADERRDYMRKLMAEKRERERVLADVSNVSPTSSITNTNTKEQDQKKARAALVLPEWLPSETWKAWCDYRNTRKGWTAKAKELSLRTLTKLHGQGFDPAAVIEKSIECGWTGLFPLGGNNANGRSNRKLSAVEQVEQAIRERREREAAGGVPFAGSNGSLVDEDGKPIRAHLG